MQARPENARTPAPARPWNALVVRARPQHDEQSDPPYYEPLRASGFDLLTVHDGLEALRMVGRVSPRFIIVDLTTPDPAILAVLETLKQDRSASDIPVMLVSPRPGNGSQHPRGEPAPGHPFSREAVGVGGPA